MFGSLDVLKYFVKFAGKQLCWSLFFNKEIPGTPVTRCLSVNFIKFLTKPALQNTSVKYMTWKLILCGSPK